MLFLLVSSVNLTCLLTLVTLNKVESILKPGEGIISE